MKPSVPLMVVDYEYYDSSRLGELPLIRKTWLIYSLCVVLLEQHFEPYLMAVVLVDLDW